MELKLTRQVRTSISTIGQLFVNGHPECHVLEDTDRGLIQSMPPEMIRIKKVHGKTAIPAGRYQVIISYSNRFKKALPLLVDVPGFEGIRIHAGNTSADTEGCLLPGTTRSKDFVGNSLLAFGSVFPKIQTALKTEKVFITIE